MSGSSKGCIITGGTLIQYQGKRSEVIIPDGVTTIRERAFFCRSSLVSVTIPASVTSIGKDAFFGCDNLTNLSILGEPIIDKGTFMFCGKLSGVFAPRLHHANLRYLGLGMQAAKTFLLRFPEYTDRDITAEYISYIASQRKKILPLIYEQDNVEVIRLLAEAKKITAKNVVKDYLQPALQSKAENCIAFLQKAAGDSAEDNGAEFNPENELWDGIHFSYDGKKMLQLPPLNGKTVYEVPTGTKEIGKQAFYLAPLDKILVPEGVTTVRNDAFCALDDRPLYIRLPASVKKLPSSIVYFSNDENCGRKYYYVSTPIKEITEKLCWDSDFNGHGGIIYTGGPIDDLPSSAKQYAIRGLLYAERQGLEDMSPWRDSYLKYTRKKQKVAVRLALKDSQLLNWMQEERVFTASGVELLLQAAQEQERPELTAQMLDYQNKIFVGKRCREKFALSENDRDLKRIAAMEMRREQIKGRKGIHGLVFVATGDFKNFGIVNEYTGAKDMSDLKEFIEEEGGLLRSAVSSKTDYLICNDPDSQSVKSKKAKELGVAVITEEEFLDMAGVRPF